MTLRYLLGYRSLILLFVGLMGAAVVVLHFALREAQKLQEIL